MPGLDFYNNIRLKNNLPTDAKYLNGKVPYSSTAQACEMIPVIERSNGLVVKVSNDEYWWRYGTEDSDLILKLSDGGIADVKIKSLPQLRAETNINTSQRFALIDPLKSGFYYYDPTDNTTPDDGVSVIVTNDGKRLKKQFGSVYRPEDFGAKGDGVTDDTAAWQACIDFLKPTGGKITCNGMATYNINDASVINLNGMQRLKPILIEGNECRILGKNIFVRTVANQADAEIAVDSKIEIRNIRFEARTVGVGIAINISCTNSSVIENCYFLGFETAKIFRFGLHTLCRGNKHVWCKYATIFQKGNWTDATGANSQSNASISLHETYSGASGNTEGIGVWVVSSSDCAVLHYTCEGHTFKHGILFDNDYSSVVLDFTISHVHSEALNVTDATICIKPAGGSVSIDRIFQQAAGRILKVETLVGYPVIKVSRMDWTLGNTIYNNQVQNSFIFEQMPNGWDFVPAFETTGGSFLANNILNLSSDSVDARTLLLKSRGGMTLESVTGIFQLPQLVSGNQTSILSISDANILYKAPRYPHGTTAQRPVLAAGTFVGYQYFDTTIETLLVWKGTEWKSASIDSDDLSDVAFSGDYNDLTNKPEGGVGVGGLWQDYVVDEDIAIAISGPKLYHGIILSSTANLSLLKIGTSPGAGNVYSGPMTANNEDQENDVLIGSRWFPKDFALFVSGVTSGELTIITNYSTYTPAIP